MFRKSFSEILSKVNYSIILVLVFLIPLFFAPFTTDYFDSPKLILLSLGVLILLILSSLKWVMDGKVLITKTPLDLPLILFLVVVILSSVFSDNRYISIVGNFPRIHGSAAAWICYVLFYFLATSNLKTQFQIRNLIQALILSTTFVAIINLASYFNIFLPFNFSKVNNFSPTGSSFSTAALIVLLLPLLFASIIKPNDNSSSKIKFLPVNMSLVLATLFGVVLVLTGDFSFQIIALIGVGLVVFVTKKNVLQKTLPFLAIPVVVALVILLVGLLPIGNKNPLQQMRLNFPREIQLPFQLSWKVSASAFRDAPFLGTGPNSYLFNFTAYKPVEINSTPLWNLRFDSSFNEYLQDLGTLGGLGLLAIIFLSVMILNFGWRGIAYMGSLANNPVNSNINLGLSISAILAVLLMVFHITSPVSIVTTLILIAILMTIHKSFTGKVEEISLGIKASKLTDSAAMQNLIVGDVLPVILFIPIVIVMGVILWNGTKIVLADFHHRLALNAVSTRSVDTYNELVKAERLNPWVDLYRTDLAQTNFALANAIATVKGPTQASPSGYLTDADKSNIQTLLSQSINEARAATALSPRSAANFEVLASIYRQISGVAQNALTFSLDAYGRAIQLDPLNPLLRLNVGGVYYSIKNYDLAIRFFTDSVNLKPDFANGYYNLSVALRDKGDLQGAQSAAEAVVQLVDPKSSDYKTVSNYLADLKARIATGSANAQQLTPPAAQESAALQKKQLPNVLNLPQVENIATPEAVKKNPQVNIPTTSPSASPSSYP